MERVKLIQSAGLQIYINQCFTASFSPREKNSHASRLDLLVLSRVSEFRGRCPTVGWNEKEMLNIKRTDPCVQKDISFKGREMWGFWYPETKGEGPNSPSSFVVARVFSTQRLFSFDCDSRLQVRAERGC